MIHVTDFDDIGAGDPSRRAAVTIGNFDGCHLGHQYLARATVAAAARLGAVATAVTFRPRPEAFFQGTPQQPTLFTDEQKSRALGELGLACQVVQRFDAAFASITAEAFYERQLRRQLGAVALVVGDDFRFGHRRCGNAITLATWGARDNVAVIIGEAAIEAGERISSTRVRTTLIQTGDAAAAARMLGRPYLLEGVIRRGDQLGRTLDVPTANIEEVGQLLPRFGIYAGYVWLQPPGDAAARPPLLAVPDHATAAVFSIGIRPTLDDPQPPVRVEAHLLSGHYGPDDLYGLRAGYYLTDWLRPELKLPDLDALKRQMRLDIAEARARLGRGAG